jgi:hypothetical protein
MLTILMFSPERLSAGEEWKAAARVLSDDGYGLSNLPASFKGAILPFSLDNALYVDFLHRLMLWV